MSICARVITISDSISAGQGLDCSGPLAVEMLAAYGVQASGVTVVPDGVVSVQRAVLEAIEEGARVVFTTGGTGVGERDLTPEAVEPLLRARLDGVAFQIWQRGLRNTPHAVLSRTVVGTVVNAVSGTSAVLVCAPGSTGGVADCVEVVGPLIAHLLQQMDDGGH